MRPTRRSVLLGVVALGLPVAAGAQSDFPSRPLKIIVPQPPGGGFDFVGRTLAEAMSKGLGQSVVVENRPGSGAPAKTPAPALARLRSELQRVAQLPEVKETFTKAGGRPLPLGAEETRALLARDHERWTKLVRAAGLKAE